MRGQLVSILIPCHNADPWLAQTIQSALDQTWPTREIIVVDDGSTDRSLSVAKVFEREGVKVIVQEHRGASAARNRAFANATGDYIQFLDADDLLNPDKIETQMKRLQAGPQGSIASCQWGRFQQLPDQARFVREPVWVDATPIDWLVTSWSGGGMMQPAVWLVPRQIAELAGPWDESLGLNDDGEFFTRIVLASTAVLFCEDARVYYRSSLPSSLASRKDRVAQESYFRSIVLGAGHLLETEDSIRTRRAAANLIQIFAHSAYLDAPDLVESAEQAMVGLGGADIEFRREGVLGMLTTVLGWKRALRVHRGLQLMRESIQMTWDVPAPAANARVISARPHASRK